MKAARYIYLILVGLAPICASAEQDIEPKPPLVVPGEVLIEFKEVAAANGSAKLPANLSRISSGVFSFRSTGYADGATAVPLDKKALDANCKFARKRLEASGVALKVESCEPNYVFQASKTANDSYMSYLKQPFDSSGVFEAWDITQGSQEIVVAVIDTGIDYKHPDLAANMYQNLGEIPGNKIDDDKNGYVDDVYGYDFANNDSDPMDGNGHGTHCAGVIGAVGNNMVGVTGINWNVKLMALKFLGDDGSGSTANAIKAIDYAVANGAKVLSNSWGALLAYSGPLRKAIERSGAIFVAAAGNDALNNDKYGTYPASFDSDNILSVAAIDPATGSLASFSNFGAKTVDIAAPGVNILSTHRQEGYAFMSGTSMATPHVAGVVALMLSLKPDAGYEELKQTILDQSKFSKQLWNLVGTSGHLDAYAAVKSFAPAEAPPEDSSSSSSGSEGDPGSGGSGSEPDDDSSSDDQSAPFEYVLLAGRATAKGNIVNGQATRKVGIEALASGESNRTDRFTLQLLTGEHACELVSDRPISSGDSISEVANLPQLGVRVTFDILLTSASGGEALTSFKANLCRLGKRCQTKLSTAQFKRICAIFQNKLSD